MRRKHSLFICFSLALFLFFLTTTIIHSALKSASISYDTINEKDESDNSTNMPIEMVISRRMSIRRHYDLDIPVPDLILSKILWAAYGFSSRGRTVPSLFNYPVRIYVCNETAAYQFIPENQSLSLWKGGDHRGLGGAYPAPVQLFIAIDSDLCQNLHWGNAETGCVIQSIYLMANSLNLGTVCTNDIWGVHQGLGLPENEIAVYKMPLGYLLPPYKDYQNLALATRPFSSELPEIKDTFITITQALNLTSSSHNWSSTHVTRQELSQLLWASYGYSYYLDTAISPAKRHRTVPSAHAYYPMKIFTADSSGVYEYIPEQHTLATIVNEDRRLNISLASGNAWAASAPLIMVIAWNDTRIATVDMTYAEVGLITQNVYLESAALGLICDWGIADAEEYAMREALGLIERTQLHPTSILAIGSPLVYFNLSITSEETGKTYPPQGTYTYLSHSSINVTAIPNLGYSFNYWLLDGEKITENPITVIMEFNHTLEAFFVDDISPEISDPIQEPSENVMAYENVTVIVTVDDGGLGVQNVTLWYNLNDEKTWLPINMVEIYPNIYHATIPGHEDCNWVRYKIIAYDKGGNQAAKDNQGFHYSYHVIPEFSSLIIISLFITATLSTIMTHRKIKKITHLF